MCIVIGSALKVSLVWNLSDLFNALMVFPNLIALLALSGLVARAAPRRRYYEKEVRQKKPAPKAFFVPAGRRCICPGRPGIV